MKLFKNITLTIVACAVGILIANASVFALKFTTKTFFSAWQYVYPVSVHVTENVYGLEKASTNLVTSFFKDVFAREKNDPVNTTENLEVPKDGKVVVADLEQMKIYTYENGEQKKEYKIISRGRPGTAWETPPGRYQILSKEENHFSNIGGVWMPWSMQFFGNFFIHGWPYYPDGTPVGEGYSGGCIRIATIDSKEIYEFSDIDTTVIVRGDVYSKETKKTEGFYEIKKGARVPFLSSKTYLVADLDTGDIIMKKNIDTQYPIASLSKLMTALISLETLNQYKTVRISDEAVKTYGSQGGFIAGEEYTLGDLLYPLILESSNDAAEAMASYQNRKSFIQNMNSKSKAIGLTNTNFEDPSGLSPKNYSTSRDLFKLVKYIFEYKSFILDVGRLKEYSAGQNKWFNNSKFDGDKNYLGGKNGFTDEALQTLITLWKLPLSDSDDRHVAIVLLHSNESERDTRKILNYLKDYVIYKQQ